MYGIFRIDGVKQHEVISLAYYGYSSSYLRNSPWSLNDGQAACYAWGK